MHRRFQGEAIPRASIYAYAESEHHPSLIVREGELQRACELERIARRAIDADPNRAFHAVSARKHRKPDAGRNEAAPKRPDRIDAHGDSDGYDGTHSGGVPVFPKVFYQRHHRRRGERLIQNRIESGQAG